MTAAAPPAGTDPPGRDAYPGLPAVGVVASVAPVRHERWCPVAPIDPWDLAPLSAQLHRMNAKDAGVPAAVAAASGQVATVVDAATAAIRAGGRLVYLGAGSAGRLAQLDAAEVGPTFGVPEGTVLAVVAGGAAVLQDAAEDLEDDADAAAVDLATVGFGAGDLLLAVSASGRTPYTLAGLRLARGLGARTAALVCAAGSPLAAEADLAVVVPTGREVVRGSTRLAAGTAQKIVLNQVSTLTMVALGHVYGDLMIAVRPANAKLRARALAAVTEASGRAEADASAELAAASGDAKVAVVALRTGLTTGQARQRLAAVHGDLRAALAERAAAAPPPPFVTPSGPRVAASGHSAPTSGRALFRVGLDVGGTKVHGVLVDGGGLVLAESRGLTRPGPEAVLDVLAEAVHGLAAEVGTGPDSLAGVGIGLPGVVDARRGSVRHAVNLGLEGELPLAARLADRLGLPVMLDNDVNTAALGAWHALGLAGRDAAYLGLGTGLAAGLVLGGTVRHGAGGAAGEIGHLAIDPEGRPCRCGQRGCLETLASGSALARDLAAAGAPGLSARELFCDPSPAGVLRGVRDRYAGWVALAVRLLVLVADVDVVVLGGGVADAGTPLRAAVGKALARDAAHSPFLAGLDLPGRLLLAPAGLPFAAVGAALLRPAEVPR